MFLQSNYIVNRNCVSVESGPSIEITQASRILIIIRHRFQMFLENRSQ